MALPNMSPKIEEYYRAWVERDKLFGHSSDEEDFFRFVRACRVYGKKHRDGYWLRKQLEKESSPIPQHWIDQAASWFDICYAYDATIHPRFSAAQVAASDAYQAQQHTKKNS